MEDNSKDNNLPVTLNVTSWTKHPSWIKIDGETTISGEEGTTMPALTVLRSQDYDGKLTYHSSNEDVVKINAETGVMTLVAQGTATITIIGAETDYRLAPVSIGYTITVTEASGIDAVSADHLENSTIYDLQGRAVSNKVRKGLYIIGTKKVYIK